MTGAEQLEHWLEPLKSDPQRVIDECWKNADLYSYSNPLVPSSVCTYIVNYNPKAWKFLGLLSAGDARTWFNFSVVALLFTLLVIILVLVDIKLIRGRHKT